MINGQEMQASAPAEERVLTHERRLAWVSLLNTYICGLRAARLGCEEDLDTFLMLLVIAARTVRHPFFQPQREFDSGEDLPSLGTNVRSISDSLQIPRETVRRKTALLAQSGLVRRQGQKLHLTPKGWAKLEALLAQLPQLRPTE